MAQRTLEEVFRTISPRRRGIPNPAALGEGFTNNTGDLTTSLSQVGNEITQLRSVYQQQHDLITANTQAVQNNTSSKGGSAGSTAAHVASSVFGGALSFLSPIANGLLSLFKGGSSAPAPLPFYSAPPAIDVQGFLRAPSTAGSPQTVAPSAPQQQNAATNITVHVNAMDSQSFMDRSSDIASAVREAMLNNHPINGVVADL